MPFLELLLHSSVWFVIIFTIPKMTLTMTHRLIRKDNTITIERLKFPRFKAKLHMSNSEYRAMVNGEPFDVEFNDVQWLDKTNMMP